MVPNGKGIRIIIAGGGTGGHVFPAVAIAGEFMERPGVDNVLFVGTRKGLEARVVADTGFSLRTITVEGVRGKKIVAMLISLLKIPWSIIQSISIIHDFKPDIVLGVGGYASGPVVLSAHCMGIKTAIAEQNALPGFTNRMLARFVNKIFLSFPDRGEWFPDAKSIVTGNPVRKDFVTGITGYQRTKDTFSILVFGGSQGAQAINKAVIDSIRHLEDIKDRLTITHQTGARDMDEVSAAYRMYGINADVRSFIDDMSSAYEKADLLICRAGATSIAEITASGKASVLIPYPFAAGGHQALNARMLADAGAAEMILQRELDGERIAGIIRKLFNDAGLIMKMEKESEKLGNTKAAERIVDECLGMLVPKAPAGKNI